MTSATPYVGVLLEQTLGHVSHGRNLCQTFGQVDGAEVDWRELPFEPSATHQPLCFKSVDDCAYRKLRAWIASWLAGGPPEVVDPYVILGTPPL